MNVDKLLDIINSKQNNNPTKFYEQSIYLLKVLDVIYEIPNNEYILEPIRLYLLQNKHYIYLADQCYTEGKKRLIYRVLDLTDNARNNLLKQINAIEKEDIKGLCDDIKNVPYDLCVIVSNEPIKDNNLIPVISNYANISLLFGYESLQILDHQILPRLCKFIFSEDTTIMKSISTYTSFYEFHKTLNNETKDRLLVFSGSVLLSIGTTYTSDIDIMYTTIGQTNNEIEKVEKILLDKKYTDYHMIYKDKITKRKGGPEPRDYLFKWFTECWPQLCGIECLAELFVNPKHYFHFMGMKFMSVDMTMRRLECRSSSTSFVDLIMLEKINGYKSEICFPNLAIQQGKITIFNDAVIKNKLELIKKYLKEWHNLDVDINELKSMIPMCSDLPFQIYSKNPTRNKYTNRVIEYHTKAVMYYMYKYLKTDSLLDIGAGPLRQINFYNRMKIKTLVAIEPSKDSIVKGEERYRESNSDIDLYMIEGVGDQLWSTKEKYEPVFNNKPYKSILFKFTIHYMLKNMDIVLKNIQSVEAKDTTIMISCLDGNKIMRKLKEHNGRYEIMQGDEPLYGVYDFSDGSEDNARRIMVYFRGVYGVEMGSIEYAVDIEKLIKQFENIGYKLVFNRNFNDFQEPHLKQVRDHYNKAQQLISELHYMIILTKNKEYINENYRYMYKKCAKKYMDMKKN